VNAHRAAWCLIAGLALMTISLAWFTPFGAFPDELDHYERALSIGNGELVGVANPSPKLAVHHKTCCTPGNPSARSWVGQGVRMVNVDSAQHPETLPCGDVVTGERLACGVAPAPGRQTNAMGTIEPLAYAPGGVIANAFQSPTAAYRVTRIAPAILALVLIAMAVFALRRRFAGPATTAAIVVSLSVGTLAVVASGAPNAFEACGAVCFLAGALALTDHDDVTAADWWCLGAGGFALTTSRSLGPIWIVALLVVAICVGTTRRGVAQVRANRRAASVVAAVIAAGALSTVAWEAVVQPHVAFDLSFFLHRIGPTFGDAGFASRQLFASVGSMPPALYAWIWIALGALLTVGGLLFGTGRARLAIVVAAVSLVGGFVGISAAILNQNGFGIQARHVLPVVVAFVIASGVAWRDRHVPVLASVVFALATATLLSVAWGYLRTSYGVTPAGLTPVAPTIGRALRALAARQSVAFVAGAALAGASIALSGVEPAPDARRVAHQVG
jgi:hypothetical protein